MFPGGLISASSRSIGRIAEFVDRLLHGRRSSDRAAAEEARDRCGRDTREPRHVSDGCISGDRYASLHRLK